MSQGNVYYFVLIVPTVWTDRMSSTLSDKYMTGARTGTKAILYRFYVNGTCTLVVSGGH